MLGAMLGAGSNTGSNARSMLGAGSNAKSMLGAGSNVRSNARSREQG